MGPFLIGFGVGTLMVAGINYFEKNENSIIPNGFILATGVATLIGGLLVILL